MKKIKNTLSALKFLKKIVIFCITVVLIYTIVAVVYQTFSDIELSATLTENVFRLFGLELCMTAVLKIVDAIKEALESRNSESDSYASSLEDTVSDNEDGLGIVSDDVEETEDESHSDTTVEDDTSSSEAFSEIMKNYMDFYSGISPEELE